MFEVETDAHGGTTVSIDGYPQSYVHPGDPELLVFGYVQHLAAVLDALGTGPLAVTHVGGAAMTLPRYVHHTRPGSPQIVLEPDAALTERVRQVLPLPRGHRIRVRPQPGRQGVAALKDDSAAVVVVDAYADSQVPANLTTTEWFADVARVLHEDGVVLMNAADEPDHRHVARVHAALASELPHTLAVAEVDIWKRRRFGNLVLVGSRVPLPVAEIVRQVAKAPFPSRVLDGTALTRALGSAAPFTDHDARPSPPPPTPAGQWRLR
ncbi:spermidine synthase [Nostocoides sp. HKS02]|uniref:spermidine synthase n=1 Tax=Nostocoides sp. HKS02 TaxID=1813880 RepID=UPI001E53541E|nr:fused MFS/spermidine synthase [Tetrasphaera sp. HKS02]